MKRYIIVLSSLTVFVNHVCAQGLLNNGARIVMTGASHIVIDAAPGNYLSQAGGLITPSATGNIWVAGNWTNNAGNTGFSADAGAVNLNGANQNIAGTASTTFFNLNLLGTGTKTLNVATSVGGVTTTTGVLSLGTRPLNLNSFMLTVRNPAAGAITNTTGYIQSETNIAGNPSIVRWNIGTATGARVIPFGTVTGTLIPFTYNATVAMGALTDFFQVATRPTAASNNLPWSTGVAHMFDPNLNQDGSNEAVIDRWWDITASAASTASVTFSYLGSENTMIAPFQTGAIGAQYWAAGWLPDNANIGSAPAVTVGVGSVTAPGLAFAAGAFTPMVLSSLAAPLPIELINFEANCNDNRTVLNWSTATEINNSHFTIWKSNDGVSYRSIVTVQGAGFSSQIRNYSFVDVETNTTTVYYKLQQTDFNGQSEEFDAVVGEACGDPGDVVYAFGDGSDLFVQFQLIFAGNYTVEVYDAAGRLVSAEQLNSPEGFSTTKLNTQGWSSGVYLIRVSQGNVQVESKRAALVR
jgi:hypothetical protein